MSSLTIFLSHKQVDQERAYRLKTELEALSGRSVLVYIAGFNFGRPFEQEVFDKLATSDWLMLLFTDREARWDWCLFECGFFFGTNPTDDHRRMIVLHDSDVEPYHDLPKPLTRWHSVRLDPQARRPLLWLLSTMFEEPLRPGERPIRPELLKDDWYKERLIAAFERAFKPDGPSDDLGPDVHGATRNAS